LQGFQQKSRTSIIESVFSEHEYALNWEITKKCNFSCHYCINPPDINDEGAVIIDNRQILQAFRNTQKTWYINITGGEPFLFPDFIALLSGLSESNLVSVDTNLSTSNIFELPSVKNIQNIGAIYASYHYDERKKHIGGIQNFIEKVLFLQQNSIDVIVSLVAYPDSLDDLSGQISFLRNSGIKKITPKLFIGDHNGKSYPAAYSMEEISNLEQLRTCFEIDFLPFDNRTKGRPCYAGNKYFYMNRFGDLYRCSSVFEKCGNLFRKEISIDRTSRKCTAAICNCAFEGIFLSKAKKGIFVF